MRQGVRQARERKQRENFERQHMMMERAQRERDGSTSTVSVGLYRVRRWTGFEWRDPEEELREAWEQARRERERHLDRTAGIIERKLIDRESRMNPRCVRVRIDGVPQLMFELTLHATDEDDARRRAMRVIGRALSAKLPAGWGRKVALNPPWGRLEVEEQVAFR